MNNRGIDGSSNNYDKRTRQGNKKDDDPIETGKTLKGISEGSLVKGTGRSVLRGPARLRRSTSMPVDGTSLSKGELKRSKSSINFSDQMAKGIGEVVSLPEISGGDGSLVLDLLLKILDFCQDINPNSEAPLDFAQISFDFANDENVIVESSKYIEPNPTGKNPSRHLHRMQSLENDDEGRKSIHGQAKYFKGGSTAYLTSFDGIVRKTDTNIDPLVEGVDAASVAKSDTRLSEAQRAQLVNIRPQQIRAGFGFKITPENITKIQNLYDELVKGTQQDHDSDHLVVQLAKEIKKIGLEELVFFQDMEAMQGSNVSDALMDSKDGHFVNNKPKEIAGAVANILAKNILLSADASIKSSSQGLDDMSSKKTFFDPQESANGAEDQELLSASQGPSTADKLYRGRKWEAAEGGVRNLDEFMKKVSKKFPGCYPEKYTDIVIPNSLFNKITQGGDPVQDELLIGDIVGNINSLFQNSFNIDIPYVAGSMAGDPNPSNAMVDDDLNVKLIDNRPPDPHDIFADLSKFIFGLDGFIASLEGKLELTMDGAIVNIETKDGEMSLEDIQNRLLEAKEVVFNTVENVIIEKNREIVIKDPEWKARVEFFAISQFIRDIRVASEKIESLNTEIEDLKTSADSQESNKLERLYGDLKSNVDRIIMNLIYARCHYDSFIAGKSEEVPGNEDGVK